MKGNAFLVDITFGLNVVYNRHSDKLETVPGSDLGRQSRQEVSTILASSRNTGKQTK